MENLLPPEFGKPVPPEEQIARIDCSKCGTVWETPAADLGYASEVPCPACKHVNWLRKENFERGTSTEEELRDYLKPDDR